MNKMGKKLMTIGMAMLIPTATIVPAMPTAVVAKAKKATKTTKSTKTSTHKSTTNVKMAAKNPYHGNTTKQTNPRNPKVNVHNGHRGTVTPKQQGKAKKWAGLAAVGGAVAGAGAIIANYWPAIFCFA